MLIIDLFVFCVFLLAFEMHGDRLEAETETVTNILRLIRRLAASERYEREGGVDNTSCLKSINIQ